MSGKAHEGKTLFASTLSSSLDETKKIANEFAKDLSPGDVILLQGDLGSGKTTFCRSIIEALSGNEPLPEVSSPTFGLMNQYRLQDLCICHFDLYRLPSIEEFAMRGFLEYLHDEKTICLIEWGEELERAFYPGKTWKCSIEMHPGEKRIFTISKMR